MDDENQIHVPQSFLALYSDAQQRLRAPADAVRARYELCEDLAGHLVERAQTLHQVQAPCEEDILRRMHAGLSSAESGVSLPEAVWIVTRLAELLAWPCPAFTAPR
ncbi:hypothetical protein [Verminephrobacter aporrectodeae]|uniref:ATPase with chaperone activity n=1 Tax=Verminephrobacter aporrectodeae subsp. tuberculatae TaxID=1110392 RepID=A0ABT3KVT1_9BURK|nr:hypothetical protein [Verminephrobacter aporrectodeae]MCW5223295.1 hypothetical protein [Verminephrobacter aporrectodeae subsp. tuberculatae]MCW5256493.1 hypothetical protein [Verminephrobacter aporrectodeae subsp. tuberculatae]MCW5288759.1 hypothetical protein [Verminephrobacter aporrectodeae subsp. tuberculatae]MCW5322346.1 hypothetical protein [Verminephrobacter aporrectodeae subsp. tuberculatae]MCW8166228.1 hypothetical protein [Verminephrobacter aporrectodeae subsp. tuberculatae]